MKRYIAYFDFLGYKSFILNNTEEYVLTRANHILRDIELALAQDNDLLPMGNVLVADLESFKINCLNISDTVIFWTKDNSLESLEQLLAVANQFNSREILHNIPVRGVVVCDAMEMLKGQDTNAEGAVYSKNLIYGRGLISAHLKSENLNFAGCVIDNSVIAEIETETDVEAFMSPFAKLYPVPYKQAMADQPDEYILNLVSQPLNDLAYDNYKNNIESRFAADNKPVDSPRVQELILNTVQCLESYRVTV